MGMFRKRQKDSQPMAAADVLATVLAGLERSPGMGEAQARLHVLWQHWDMVMGPDLAPLAHPLGQHHGVLLIGAEDAMLAQELHLMGAEMLERVNAFMECAFFSGVKVELLRRKKGLNAASPAASPTGDGNRDWRSAPETFPPLSCAAGRFLEGMDVASPVARAYKRFTQSRTRD